METKTKNEKTKELNSSFQPVMCINPGYVSPGYIKQVLVSNAKIAAHYEQQMKLEANQKPGKVIQRQVISSASLGVKAAAPIPAPAPKPLPAKKPTIAEIRSKINNDYSLPSAARTPTLANAEIAYKHTDANGKLDKSKFSSEEAYFYDFNEKKIQSILKSK